MLFLVSNSAVAACPLGNVQLILQKLIHDFNHAFYGHGLFCYHKAAVGICGGKLGFEGFALHLVVGVAFLDALLFVYIKNCGQKGGVFAQNQCKVEVFKTSQAVF